jgi:hypothetical protein
MQLVNKAATADPNATRLLLGLVQGIKGQAAPDLTQESKTEEQPLSEMDALVMANLNARLFGKKEPSDA